MKEFFKDWKKTYWLIIISLLLVPFTKSFIIGIQKVINSIVENTEYKSSLTVLNEENKKLKNKVMYYKSEKGTKALVKDRLNKVEDGEYIIKYKKN